MSDIAFYRSKAAKLFTVRIVCQGLGYALNLNGIADCSPCPVGLKISEIFRLNGKTFPGTVHKVRLCVDVQGCKGGRGAVTVCSVSPYQCIYPVF